MVKSELILLNQKISDEVVFLVLTTNLAILRNIVTIEKQRDFDSTARI